jgi:hypothetical protein
LDESADIQYDSSIEANIEITKEKIEEVRRENIYKDFYINLGIYIQRVSLPNIQIDGGEDVQSMIGKFPIPGKIV